MYYSELSNILVNLLYSEDVKFKLKMIIFYKLLKNYCKTISIIIKNVKK